MQRRLASQNQNKFSYRISDFGGGVDLKSDDEEMGKNRARIKQNWRNSTGGALEKVPGIERLSGRVVAKTFNGAGLDDLTSGGSNTAHETFDMKIEIDGVGTPNTFKWSVDAGATWEETTVAITGAAQTLDNGITVTFAATTGHTAGDDWTFKAYQGIDDALITMLHRYYSGSTKHFLALCNGKLWKRNTVWAQVTDGAGLSASVKTSSLNYKGNAYFMNTVDGLFYYNGSKKLAGGTVDATVEDGGNSGTLLLVSSGYNSGGERDYLVEIDGTGSPNTFKWSIDAGASWEASTVAITGADQTLENGVIINFSATTGGVSGDKWTFTVHKGSPDEKCSQIKQFRDRGIAGCGNTDETARLWFTALENMSDWSSADNAGYHDVGGNKSGKLTGYEPFGNAIIAFKERGAWRVWNFPDSQDEQLLGAPGCDAPDSIAQGDGLLFHHAQEGVYMFDGSKFDYISDEIRDVLSRIPQQYVSSIRGVYKDHAYWMFFNAYGSGVSYNLVCWRYDVVMAGWEEIPSRYVNAVAHWLGLGDEGELYAGSSQADGVVWRLNYSSDGSNDGSNIEARYKTKNEHCGLANVVKGFDRLFVEVMGTVGILSVYWEIDKGKKSGSFTINLATTGVKLDEFVLGTDALLLEPPFAIYECIFPLDAVGKLINLEVYHSNIGESPIVNSLEIEGRGIHK